LKKSSTALWKSKTGLVSFLKKTSAGEMLAELDR